MEPLISVIVPVYKVEQYLDECVQSIINQTYKNLEIILVDDGSPDRCPEMCDEYARQDSRIKVIHKPNGGLSSARNAGIEIARGEYIGFVDSDDYIAHDMYEKLYKAFEGTEKIFAVKCNYKRLAEGKLQPHKWWPNENMNILPSEDYIMSMVSNEVSCQVWDMLIQRKHLYVRFTEGKLAEDLLFNYHLGYYVEEHQLLLKHISEELYIYRDTVGSITNDKENLFIVSIIDNLIYMYQDAAEKGKTEVSNYLYAQSASRLYELNMLMASNVNLKRKYYRKYHRKMYEYDWPSLTTNWGLRYRMGLLLVLYFPQLLSFSHVRNFVLKQGITPPWN